MHPGKDGGPCLETTSGPGAAERGASGADPLNRALVMSVVSDWGLAGGIFPLICLAPSMLWGILYFSA